uniref:Cytochrome P450 monooxygenase iccC n=1 Tax=Talaromyces variabilis TaxID=28576 RepID=ICCC_TALVA|nr:RecName: Full=Cytochrome P450 monooxygenase iccC; AltName: Full=Ilicicolin H biosynthesis cluster protein C [Talaromyces variabilis]QBQ83705.1 ring expansion P450 [Talaromyces variabilis]
MITLQNLPWILLYTGFLAIFLSRLFSNGKQSRDEKANGCQPPARYPQWDPIMGLDLVYSQVSALKNNRYLEWLRDLHAKMPKTFSLNFFGQRWIYSIEPEILKAVYATNFRDFGVEPIRRHSKGSMPFADKGVNTTDGEDWEFSRLLIKPFFERNVYTDTDRIKVHADHFLSLIPADGETFDAQPLVQRWFLDLTTEFIFGESMGSLAHPERADIAWTMLDVLRGGRLRAQMHRFMWARDWTWWLKAVYKVHDYVNPYIRSTLKELAEREERIKQGLPVGPERTDLVWSMATHLRDEELLRSQLCLIIVPNNDTTSIFISNCLWHLARHPEVWKKLREEVFALGEETPLTFEILRNMKYLNGVLNETHRVIPNNVTQVRACVQDTVLPVGGGPDGKWPVQVRKGDIVSVTKTVMYRDPDYWGSDADEFRPERFDGLRGTWNFLPFGGGPRRCPAQMMSQTEAAYMLCRLARTYSRIEARDPEPYTAVMRIGPSNKTGVKIALYK